MQSTSIVCKEVIVNGSMTMKTKKNKRWLMWTGELLSRIRTIETTENNNENDQLSQFIIVCNIRENKATLI